MRVQGSVLELFQQRPATFYRGFLPTGCPVLFSVSFEEHLTDCGIIVIDVLEEPLLGDPLLGHGLLKDSTYVSVKK